MISVEEFTSRVQDPLGTVAICARDHMNIATVTSLLGLRLPSPGVDRVMSVGSVLAWQRNRCVQKMRGDWILFIDDDMVFAPDALLRLLDTYWELKDEGLDPDVVGGLCFRRSPPHHPTLYMRNASGAGPYAIMEDYFGSEVLEVDATGMAFCLISISAFEKLAGEPMPPWEDRKQASKPAEIFQWVGGMGEDLRFCQVLKERGGRIFVDTRIKIGHVFEKQVGERDWLQSLAARDDGELAAMREHLGPYGMEAVTPARAEELLRG